jgi:hypothetical protein
LTNNLAEIENTSISYKRFAIICLIFGAVILCFALFLFLCKISTDINFYADIDTAKFDHFGSFAAGSIGLLWSLAGVFLLIDSLNEQKRATDENIKQIKIQQFENTFFQLINVHFETTHSMKIEMVDSEYGEKLKDDEDNILVKSGANFFEEFASVLKIKFDKIHPIENTITNDEFIETLTQICEEHFFLYSADLGHYYGNIRIMLQFIYEFIIGEDAGWLSPEKKGKYIKILQSQLSNYEVLILAYYVLTHKGDELFNLVEKTNMLISLPNFIAIEKKKANKWEPIIIRPKFLKLNFKHLN